MGRFWRRTHGIHLPFLMPTTLTFSSWRKWDMGPPQKVPPPSAGCQNTQFHMFTVLFLEYHCRWHDCSSTVQDKPVCGSRAVKTNYVNSLGRHGVAETCWHDAPAHLSFQIADSYRGRVCLAGADVNETGGQKRWQAEPGQGGDDEITLSFSQQLEMEDEDTIDVFQQQTGGWIWPASRRRVSPSQHNRYDTTGCFFLLNYCSSKTQCRSCHLLRITAVQYYSCSLFV